MGLLDCSISISRNATHYELPAMFKLPQWLKINQTQSKESTYEERQLAFAAATMAKGHNDVTNLRELLICTTSKTTCAMVEEYFRKHHHDQNLLANLVSIAMEGDDAGDAPWAAANTIVDFPAKMLVEYKPQLVALSKHEWFYLNVPAKEALSKIAHA
jgi:hypothetical protein